MTATRRRNGSLVVNNPLLILQSLDRHLDHPIELTLYGRAALALGFPAHERRHKTTQDVDVIIPLGQLDELRADAQFWDARDATNAELADRGLYLSHLFTEADVFLQHDPLSVAELRASFDRVRLPDIQELRDAFRVAQPKVLALAQARERGDSQTG